MLAFMFEKKKLNEGRRVIFPQKRPGRGDAMMIG